MTSISVEEALHKAREILELALTGERIVIVGKGGERILVAQERRGQTSREAKLPDRVPGVLAGTLVVGPEFFDPLPEDEIPGL